MEPVSVIIPTFNRAAFLDRAISSVLNQKDFNGEIIIIDDGSQDNTHDIVNKLKNKCDIKYFYNSNKGPSYARNKGVRKAAYKYIAFLDSDDHWIKDKLKKQLRILHENPDYRICHTGEKWLRRGKHLNQKKIHKPRHGYIFDHCLMICGVGMSTVLMQKDLFEENGGFDTNLPCCEDYDFWLRVSCKNRFFLLSDPLIVKEGGREDQLSFRYRVGMDKFRIYAIEKLLASNQLNEKQTLLACNELKKKCEVYGRGCIKHGQVKEGEKYLKKPEIYNC